MSEVKTSKNVPAFHILLPVCTESNVDIFFKILKCTVARSKLDEHHLTKAFMSGMKGEKFVLEMDDLTLNWEQLTSEEQKIRQAKILGFWAIVNFPALQKKLFGKENRTPSRNGVSVVGNVGIKAEKIDELVFPKMKLRVVELCVIESTFFRLKHFVKVPGCVGVRRNNEISISPKMVSFDVDAEFVDSCWHALKIGKFSMISEDEHQVHTAMFPFVAHQIDTDENDQTIPQPKRLCRRQSSGNIRPMYASVYSLDGENDGAMRADNTENDSQTISQTGIQLCEKRLEHDLVRNIDSVFDAEETNDDSNIDSLRKIILHLRDDVGTLTKLIQDKRDEEMGRINSLVIGRANMEQKIEDQAAVSLNEKYKTAFSLESSDQLKVEVELFTRKLYEAERDVASKSKVEVQVASLRKNSDSVVAELRKEIEANTSVIEKYKSDLAASLQLNEQLQIEAVRLRRELLEAAKEIESNKILKDKLVNLQAKLGCIVNDLLFEIECLTKITSESINERERLELDITTQIDEMADVSNIQILNAFSCASWSNSDSSGFENSNFIPGFTHPPDEDRKRTVDTSK